jgi:tRNA(fMet)-specific endonuclease VapC
MSPLYMLDTNICIYIRRARPRSVLERFAEIGSDRAVISVVTYGELRVGAEKGDQRARDLAVLDELVTRLRVDAMPIEAGIHYGMIRADLEQRGERIGNNDLWIAAHARAADMTLVTNNEREFRRVPGLRIENWVQPA